MKEQQVASLVVVQTHLAKIAAPGVMNFVLIDVQRIILEIIPGQCDGRAIRYVGVICLNSKGGETWRKENDRDEIKI